MGIVAKQSSNNLIVLFLGVFIGAVNIIFLYPKILSQEEFGLTRILISIAIISANIGAFGTPSSLLKFLPYFHETLANKWRLLRFTLKIALIATLIVSAGLFLFQGLISSQYDEGATLVSDNYYFLYFLVLFIVPNSILSSYSRAVYLSVFPSFLNDVLLRFLHTFLLLLFYFDWIDFNDFMYGYVGSYLLIAVLLVFYLWFKGELAFRHKKIEDKTSLTNAPEILRYGGVNFLTGLASGLANKVDVLMLAVVLTCVVCTGNEGLEAVALYSWALFISSLVEMPARAVSAIGITLIGKAWKENDLAEIDHLYKSSAMTQLIIGSLIFFGIWLNIELLFSIEPSYEPAKWVIFLLGLGKLVDISSGLNYHIINTSKYYYFVTILLIFLVLLTIVTNYIFIPLYGVNGAAMATGISMVVYNLISFLFLWIKYRMQPFSWRTLIVLLIAVGSYFIVEPIHLAQNIILDAIIRSICMVILFGGLILVSKVSTDVNTLFFKIIKRLTSR